MTGCAGYTLGRGPVNLKDMGERTVSRGAWQLQLCRVGVNFGALDFVRFLGSLSFHLRGSGCGGEVVVFIKSVVYAMAAMRPNAI